MKIGEYKFKRKYSFARIIVDIASVLFLFLIIANTFSFAEYIESTNAYLNRAEVEVTLMSWHPLVIWPIITSVLFIVSVVYMMMPKKIPKKYNIDETNVRQYCDIIDTAISCIRLIIFFLIFDLSCIHFENLAYIRQSWFSLVMVCDVFFVIVLLRFTAHRLRAISVKEKEKEIKIIEN